MPHNRTPPEIEDRIAEMRRANETVAYICSELCVSEKVVRRICRERGLLLTKSQAGKKSKRLMHQLGKNFHITKSRHR
jgi:hypothetical protein